MHQPKFTEARLFEPPPIRREAISVVLTVHLDGPSDHVTCGVLIRDSATRETLSMWVDHARRLSDWPAVTGEILGDAVRAALGDLAPF